MARVERTEIFNIGIDDMYGVITDYESYPEFVDGMVDVNIIKKTKAAAKVEFFLNLIKKINYTLDIKQKSPTKVSWTLVEGNIFKKNIGGWVLEDLGKKGTKVTYALDLEFKGFAPKVLVNKLVANNLPSMMKSVYNRASGK